jgi:hypothetical protein
MRRALIVTANNYLHYTPLRYCHGDGHLFRRSLTEWCGYDREGVISHLELDLTDDYAAPERLLAHIRSLVDGPNGAEPFLFYFAGHGLYDDRTSTSYLLFPRSRPDDLSGTALPVRLLRDTLAEIGCPIVQIFDACHSGEAFRGRGDDGSAIAPNVRGFVADLRRSAQRPDQLGWEMLAACDENESSYEDPELQHGVFTQALAQAIRDTPPGDDVLLQTLTYAVCPRVRAWAERYGVSQNPVFAARTFGPLPFARRKREAPPPSPSPSVPPPEPVTRHQVTLAARRDTEIDLASFVRRPSSRFPAPRLTLRVHFERGSVRYELVGDPSLTHTGRHVKPKFFIEADQVLRGGPYVWEDRHIRCEFAKHQASISFYGLTDPEVRLSVDIAKSQVVAD